MKNHVPIAGRFCLLLLTALLTSCSTDGIPSGATSTEQPTSGTASASAVTVTAPDLPLPPDEDHPTASSPSPTQSEEEEDSAHIEDAPAETPSEGDMNSGSTQTRGVSDSISVVAGRDAITVLSVSGVGTVPVGYVRNPNSAAPNIPVYTSAICGGVSTYSGAFNATGTGEEWKDVPYSGDCVIKVKAALPSSKWAGSFSAVNVRTGTPDKWGGDPVVVNAGWVSRAVSSSGDFVLNVPKGFTGVISVKVTACSSEGGTSDNTVSYGCAGLVRKGVGSSFSITVSDSVGVINSVSTNLSAERHHDTISIPVGRAASGTITVRVVHTGGSAVLVHGPSTRAVGVR